MMMTTTTTMMMMMMIEGAIASVGAVVIKASESRHQN
jgi:hypothetical protein